MFFPSHRTQFIFFALLAVVVGGIMMRAFMLSRAPVYEDEVLSITVTRAIARVGRPRLPTGALYLPGIVPNTVAAVGVRLFGDSLTVHRSVSYGVSLVLLVVMFFIARRYFGTLTAGALVLFFTFSRLENTYSVSARMYMMLQFFALCMVWSFYRGFVEDVKRQRWLFALWYTLALFTHIGAVVLFPVLWSFSLLMHRGTRVRQHVAFAVLTFALSCAAYGIKYFPGVLRPEIFNYLPFGFLIETGYHAQILDAYMPLSLFFFIPATFVIIRDRLRAPEKFFVLWVFAAAFILISLFVRAASRYVLFIFPLYAMLVFEGVQISRQYFRTQMPRLQYLGYVLLVLAAFTHSALGLLPRDGLVYGFGSTYYDYAPYYAQARSLVRGNDIVLCTDQIMALWYFRCNYYFRQKKMPHDQWAFFSNEQDEYFGVPFVDSLEKLKAVFASDQRVWLLADRKFWGNASPVMMGYALQVMQQVYTEDNGEVGIYRYGS